MREIKFRAKRIDNGEWVHGYYTKYSPAAKGDVIEAERDDYDIDPASVGQFTGLKDIHGVEIYECDVVELTIDDGISYNALIVYKDGGFCAIDGTDEDYAIRVYGIMRCDYDVKVIGNLFDNPELIKTIDN